MSHRRTFILGAAAAAVSHAVPVLGQRAVPPARIAFLSTSSHKAYAPVLEEFQRALVGMGHSAVIDTWWAEEKLDRLPGLIAEVLSTRPTVIVTHGSPAVSALKRATSTVPVVFASAGDPVGQGFVESFRRPGGNITGVAFNDEINKKVFELVRIVMPAAARVASLINPDNPAARHHLAIEPGTTKALGLQSLVLNATTGEALEPAFKQAAQARSQAMVVSTMAPFIGLRGRIAELQFKYRMPTFHGMREAAEAGGLASYSFPYEENFRRAAHITDRILRGTSPAEIPVEIPTKYEITINLNSAHALGMKVPESALLRATRVIAS